ncbi:MAG: histidine kinase [Lachnospiraceae bacterium]|nr:histidine kinase [Lachnospiraceae bacterium]
MKKFRWNKLSFSSKMVFQVGVIAALFFAVSTAFYLRLNKFMGNLDSVYSSNVDITLLSDTLKEVQDNMYLYLKVKSSDSLKNYYQSEAKYRELLGNLNDQTVHSASLLLEKNIRKMSETYLTDTADTVSAKRARNVEKYKKKYEESLELYRYISSEITSLNNQLFINNNKRYEALREMLRYLETSNSILMLVIVACALIFITMTSRSTVRPLTNMANTARLVGEGNFHVKMPDVESEDELGTVTRAFNTMVESLDDYMRQTQEGMRQHQKMVERELLMETHLKEAQLKFLQSQINPHFLFNSLNAGVQLAMIEDADQTGIFLEKMADFFRYNVKKGQEDATLAEELEAVDNYVYILNVRFTGDIHVTKEVDESLYDLRMPSMILQPLVENAVNHGIRDIDWEGQIRLSVEKKEDHVEIIVQDNGKGMSSEQIDAVLKGEGQQSAEQRDSTGVGMNNVIKRMELYYQQENPVRIISEGENKGTSVILSIPFREE